jgi:hypothetical protein
MNVNITDTFTKSLKTLIRHNTWWYKTYQVVRYDFWYFLGNIWKFRKELWDHRWWDYRFTLDMLYRSISIMEKGMHNGLEIKLTRDKKIQKMQRLLQLLDNKINDKYLELTEQELGYEMICKGFDFKEVDETNETGENLYKLVDNETEEERELNRRLIERSREIEESEWSEIWEIIKGQDHKDYSWDSIDVTPEQEDSKQTEKQQKDWDDWFDGSGLRGWWD